MRTIRFQYFVRRTRKTGTVTFDPIYGIGKPTGYKYGFTLPDGTVLTDRKAWKHLKSNTFGDDTVWDMLPTFHRPNETVRNPDYYYGSGLPEWIPNPNYETEVQNWDIAYGLARTFLDGFLTQLANCRWPLIPDTGNKLVWYDKIGDQWVQIPVEVGKYKGGARWVTSENETMRNAFVDYMAACVDDKRQMLKVLLQI